MPEFRMSRRVRYRECDPMGVVYHTHYLDWFEEARTEALRELGLPYVELEESGIIMPVVDLGVRYHRPVRYDDLVQIVTRMDDAPPRTRVRFDYEVRSGDTVCVTAHVTLCFVDVERSRPVTAPGRVKAVFEKLRTA
ncbi:MAG: acyl-CoA thioesterase [Rhodothermales bacterium]|nr:acyl-CoA thioesterase [Rhodothermales bacterium]MBO6779156.1 acyl-CoA thioesterase [Rhodothermales bacterium]